MTHKKNTYLKNKSLEDESIIQKTNDDIINSKLDYLAEVISKNYKQSDKSLLELFEKYLK